MATTHAAPAEPALQNRKRRSAWRMIFGLISVVLILGIGATQCVSATADRTASAVQITQIYTEGIFFVLVVLGALIAFYIAVRPD